MQTTPNSCNNKHGWGDEPIVSPRQIDGSGERQWLVSPQNNSMNHKALCLQDIQSSDRHEGVENEGTIIAILLSVTFIHLVCAVCFIYQVVETLKDVTKSYF